MVKKVKAAPADAVNEIEPIESMVEQGPEAASPAEEKEPEAPKQIRILVPHGFIDDDGSHKYWNAGDVVDNPETIKLLIQRGAHWEI